MNADLNLQWNQKPLNTINRIIPKIGQNLHFNRTIISESFSTSVYQSRHPPSIYIGFKTHLFMSMGFQWSTHQLSFSDSANVDWFIQNTRGIWRTFSGNFVMYTHHTWYGTRDEIWYVMVWYGEGEDINANILYQFLMQSCFIDETKRL